MRPRTVKHEGDGMRTTYRAGRYRSWSAAASAAVLAAAVALAEGEAPAVPFADHERLPQGGAEALSQVYWTAAEVPGVASLAAAHKRSLLDVVTERYKSRLVDRAPANGARLSRHIGRLSRSGLAAANPLAVAQACAQYDVADGPCAPHAEYVMRAELLEEMLAAGRLSLDELETELEGAARPRRGTGAAGGPSRSELRAPGPAPDRGREHARSASAADARSGGREPDGSDR